MASTVPSGLSAPLKMGDSKFLPWYTPKEMLELGVYGGTFFFNERSRLHLPKELFEGINKDKWGLGVYTNSSNFYNVNAPRRSRGLNGMDPKSKLPHGFGWFQWYCQYYYGVKIDMYISIFRIHQWKEEILTFSHYLEEGVYVPPNPNPNGYDKYTDPSFLPNWKQHMIQYGWDPTKKPFDYGIR